MYRPSNRRVQAPPTGVSMPAPATPRPASTARRRNRRGPPARARPSPHRSVNESEIPATDTPPLREHASSTERPPNADGRRPDPMQLRRRRFVQSDGIQLPGRSRRRAVAQPAVQWARPARPRQPLSPDQGVHHQGDQQESDAEPPVPPADAVHAPLRCASPWGAPRLVLMPGRARTALGVGPARVAVPAVVPRVGARCSVRFGVFERLEVPPLPSVPVLRVGTIAPVNGGSAGCSVAVGTVPVDAEPHERSARSEADPVGSWLPRSARREHEIVLIQGGDVDVPESDRGVRPQPSPA